MINKLLNLKNKNKILYYILIPLIGIALIVKFLMDSNILGAVKSIKKAELKDIDLKREQEEAELKANEMLKEANEHGANAEDHENKANNDDIDIDWHLEE